MSSPQPPGFLARPSDEAASRAAPPKVLVLHAWWGLNDTVRSVCDRLAREGFVAFAPDLYRGQLATDVVEAERLAHALDERRDEVLEDIAGAASFLRSTGGPTPIAVIGFSLGAPYALQLAASDGDVSGVVLFYGTGYLDHEGSRAAYLGHFAANDPFEPRDSVEALEQSLRAAGRPVTFHHYPNTTHWFFEPDRPDAYDAAAAKVAWDCTVEFLHQQLAPAR